jgi:hypothetical protein
MREKRILEFSDDPLDESSIVAVGTTTISQLC